MMKKRRVCIIRQYYFPKEAHLRRDVKALIESDLEVDIICARDEGEKFHDYWNGINVYRLPVAHSRRGIFRYIYDYFLFSVLASFLLTLLFFKKGYGVIEVDTMPDFLVFSTIIPKLLGAKVILYLFENTPKLFSHKYNLPMNHPIPKLLRTIENICTKYANRTAMTYRRRESYLKNATILLNVPDETAFVIKGADPITQSQNGSQKKRPIIITHSTLSKIYGVQNIIRAVGLVVNKYPEIECDILGSGEYLDALVGLTHDLKLDGHVIFKGFVRFEEVPEHLRSADIGIISMLTELLPNKLFEYVALSIPVICADFKSVRDFFNDNELLFYNYESYRELALKIEWALSFPAGMMKMAKNAQDRYRKYYRWSVTKSEYLKCHKNFLE